MCQYDGMAGFIEGGAGGLIVGFWPTPTSDAAGASFGVMVAGAKEVGATLEVMWNFTDKTTVYPSPGFALGIVGGMGVEAGFIGGYSVTYP
jgi:hypothetical protein